MMLLFAVVNGILGTNLPAICALMAQCGVYYGLFIFRRNSDGIRGTGFFAEFTADASILVYLFGQPCESAESSLKSAERTNEVVEYCRFVSERNKYRHNQPERQNR